MWPLSLRAASRRSPGTEPPLPQYKIHFPEVTQQMVFSCFLVGSVVRGKKRKAQSLLPVVTWWGGEVPGRQKAWTSVRSERHLQNPICFLHVVLIIFLKFLYFMML